MSERAEGYAVAMVKAGAPLESGVCFIYGSNVYVSQTKGLAQRATYSGHKRRNSLKI